MMKMSISGTVEIIPKAANAFAIRVIGYRGETYELEVHSDGRRLNFHSEEKISVSTSQLDGKQEFHGDFWHLTLECKAIKKE